MLKNLSFSKTDNFNSASSISCIFRQHTHNKSYTKRHVHRLNDILVHFMIYFLEQIYEVDIQLVTPAPRKRKLTVTYHVYRTFQATIILRLLATDPGSLVQLKFLFIPATSLLFSKFFSRFYILNHKCQ